MKHQIATNQEWGRKARKEEDDLRGLNNADRRAAVEEQVNDIYVIPMNTAEDDAVLDMLDAEWEECADREIASPYWLRYRKRQEASRDQ